MAPANADAEKSKAANAIGIVFLIFMLFPFD
jgi:hypothetical protein